MDFVTIFLIALGLAMDAVAVSVSLGLTIRSLKIHNGLVISLFFGLFQMIMPLVGWSAGWFLKDYITGIDHWIAFGLLVIIGSRMIYESVRSRKIEEEINGLSIYLLFMLSIATSIDALAIGVSFALLDISIMKPIIIIGFVTFILSFLGVGFGRHLGRFFQKQIEIAGGLILIAIGLKILLEHLGIF